MNFAEKEARCKKYFYELAERLKETHEVVGSCNKDSSVYLIPKGSIDDLSYTSKPMNSYRYSDHWNWYANVKKCADERYIQCYCVDLPRVKQRTGDGLPSKPVHGICVAYFDKDHKYHTIFGETFDRKNREWSFKE